MLPPEETPTVGADAACAGIVAAVARAREANEFTDPRLRAAVEQCAMRCRELGIPPEQMLVKLKALLRETALTEVGEWFRGVLSDRIIVWAIEAYYGVDDS
jgi:hypothetical protein